MEKHYNIGLDIGTNSIGWVVTDNAARVVRVKGQLGYGVHLFHEGQPAADRRGFGQHDVG